MGAMETQRIEIKSLVQQFVNDRRAQGLRPGSIRFYIQKLGLFEKYCRVYKFASLLQLTADDLRRYVLSLQKDHNPGGVHAAFRTVHALFYWFEAEYEPEGWKNPIRKLKAPKVPEELLDPVDPSTVEALIDACNEKTAIDLRDKAILRFLLDTGVRASELLNMDRDDLDMATRSALIRHGKGGKARTVFYDRRTRTAIRAYLNLRTDDLKPLWLSVNREQLEYDGLRTMVVRRAKESHVEPPALHSFRRAFALARIRAGVDLITLQRLMGHASNAATTRYVKHSEADLRRAHDRKD